MSADRRSGSSKIKRFYKSLFLTNRFFLALAILVLLAMVCFIFPSLYIVLQLLTLLLVLLFVVDCFTLYKNKKQGIVAKRESADRFSNGDENQVVLTIKNNYNFTVYLNILEEIPFQFQERNMSFNITLKPLEEQKITYTLRPTERGTYQFGNINIYAETDIALIRKRFVKGEVQYISAYPAFQEINKYELLAVSDRLTDFGIKRIRRLGNATEFEHIKSYVIGDDPRTINYKATARTNELMVNTYIEERSQSVYCLIDKGRNMQMPFNGLSLLDYAINSSLVVSTTALKKGDKAGLITFSNTIDDILPASDRRIQRSRILETLYKQKTDFKDASYSNLYLTIKKTVKQRSLLILFTNFETVNALHRQIKYLKLLSRDHLLIVSFFSNTEMDKVLDISTKNEEDFFRKGIAEKMHMDKNLIVKELNRIGIYTILTPPEKLSIQAINKYLEMKTRGLI